MLSPLALPHAAQVFFDDNIERDRAHIVDVRDCHSFAPVPFAMANRRYLRRVEPYHAILDREYYVKEVQEVLRLHAEDNDQQQQQS